MMYGNRGNGYSYSPDRSRDIDRFNTSTKPNYKYFNPDRLNDVVFYGNNGQHSNHYIKTKKFN